MIWMLLLIMAYMAIAGGVIYWLLVAAWKYTDLERPWAFVLCALVWPIGALPAAGYILAGKRINEEDEALRHGKK